MKKYYFILNIFWIGLSLFVMLFSYKYGLGEVRNPGPGFLPFLLGFLLLLFSTYSFLGSLIRRGIKDEENEAKRGQIHYRRILSVLVSMVGYVILLEPLGYLVDTFLLLIILFVSAGSRKWGLVLIASALTVMATYFLFLYLGLRFPMGILKGWW